MHRLSFILLLTTIVLPAWKQARAQDDKEVMIPFYSESLRITYNPSLLLPAKPAINDRALTQYFHALSKTEYSPLLRSLSQAKKLFQLNDWLYYQLMRKVLDELYAGRSQVEKELACWFLLSQAGYDTRLAYLGEEAFVYVYSQDAVFEAPVIEDKGRQFVNLTNIRTGGGKQRALYLLNFQPSAQGHAFSFQLNELPLLRPREVPVTLRFLFRGQWNELEVKADQTIRQYMAEYPLIDEAQYLDVPLSPTLAASLLPQLRRFVKDKSEWEIAELLAAFTRSSFAYKEDKEYFGYSKPMVAEEVFLYPFSDCEDRSALYVQLCREFIGLPMIVLAYPDHLTVAIALPQTKSGFVRYKNKAYYICDPTGPVNSAVVGEIPEGYENTPFEIIKEYN
ncbi:MAG: hypothetical protein H6573_25860 [Lewinellaceae bacterium]|nr:hypothetical protein [Phaeodactylibacter sp.]MCB0612604.1 hypothetical protein [Phaeodactylibacter sp.]MCB9350902.1 hypothetical protein [Lewinellaceae bacterium]